MTLTLPENVIAALTGIDADLSRAIVRLAQPEVGKRPHLPAELAVFGRRAVILVHPTRTLEKQAGVTLIPLSDGRALISFDESTDIAQLELRLQDAIEGQRLPPEDRRIFQIVADLLKNARRSRNVVLRQSHVIILETGHAAAIRTNTNSRKVPSSPGRRRER